jgi:hypothetical protein
MSLWTLIRLLAGAAVVVAAVFTLMLAHHVREEPLGGVFSEWVPVTMEAETLTALPEADSSLPDVDPGAKVFETARERIAVGDLTGARDRLRTIVSIYPHSRVAPEARRIVGEMNFDALLSPARMDNKSVYRVKSGDSYLGIAAKQRTSLDMIRHLNGLMDLGSLQPGDELIVMPLDFRLVIDPRGRTLSLWDEGRFVREFPLRAVVRPPGGDLETKIENKIATRGGRSYPPASSGYRGADKTLTVERMPLVISALPDDAEVDGLPRGFYLSPEDMEDLALVTRVGNRVEIRSSPR